MTYIGRKKIISQASGGNTSSIDARLTILEDNEYKITYFTEISSTAGNITIPTGATILLDQLQGGVDAYVSEITNGQPNGNFPRTSGGITVDVSSFNTMGAYTLSGTPASYPVALIYILKIKAKDYSNLVISNILDLEEFNTTLQSVYNVSLPTAEIVTNATNGAVTVKGGTGTDTDDNYEGKNNAGTVTFSVDGNGKITGTTTTQSANDNSAKLASTAYVDAKTTAYIKAPVKQNQTISHTGTTNETKIFSQLITGGTFNANDLFRMFIKSLPAGGSGNKTIRIYVHTADQISGATQLATYTYTTTSVVMDRGIVFKNSLSSQEIYGGVAVSFASDMSTSFNSTNATALTNNYANDQYIIVSAQLATGSDTVSIYGIGSQIYR